MSCTVTVTVSIGPEEDPLVLSSECDDGISWTQMGLPEWEFRYTYAPPSAWVSGNVLLAAVRDSGAVPMLVSIQASSLADMEVKKAELETALTAWPGLFKVEATDDTGTVTIAGPWESFPTLPKWGDVLTPLLGYYYVEATFAIPVNPAGAP